MVFGEQREIQLKPLDKKALKIEEIVMNIILLSGGSGKRLWPLSNDSRSKQFLKLFRNDAIQTDEIAENRKGSSFLYESMLQRMHRQLRQISPTSSITIATGVNQRSAIRNQLGDAVNLCIEPVRRETFPAIALASAHMHSVQKLPEDTVVIVCPIDPYVQESYFERLLDLEKAVQTHGAALTLMGVTPTYPSEKYGYIVPDNHPMENQAADSVRKVLRFQEKPDIETAQTLMTNGALWNCGVFAFRLGYVLEISKRYLPYTDYETLVEHFAEFPKISFDYAVVEKEPNIACIQYDGDWTDVGTWNTLSEEMSENVLGNVLMQSDCVNTHAINELDVPMVVMGAQNMIVVAGPDGILVSDKERSSQLKPIVDQLEQRVMFEEKSWGQLKVLHEQPHSLTLLLHITQGKAFGLHAHTSRKEMWTVLSGEGESMVDRITRSVTAGDVILLPKGVQHQLRAITEMDIIEVQITEDETER